MGTLVPHHEFVSALRSGSQILKQLPNDNDAKPYWRTGPQIVYTVVGVEHIAVEGHTPMDYHRGKTHAVLTIDGIPWPVILPLTGSVGGFTAASGPSSD